MRELDLPYKRGLRSPRASWLEALTMIVKSWVACCLSTLVLGGAAQLSNYGDSGGGRRPQGGGGAGPRRQGGSQGGSRGQGGGASRGQGGG